MNFKHSMIVFKKELVDMFRDRKTIISSILIPILIFPIMYGFMGITQQRTTRDMEENGVKVAVISQDKDASIVKYLNEAEELRVVNVDDPDEALQKGTVKAVIYVDGGFDQVVASDKPAPVTIQYDDSNQSSLMGVGTIKTIIEEYSSAVVTRRLKEKGIDPQIINPVEITEMTLNPGEEGEGGGIGRMIFSMLIPLFIAIYAATSVLPAATDNGAGEKERGTLEPLLTTQVDRLSLLTGKYLAITVAGVIGTAASMFGLLVAQRLNPEMLGASMALSPIALLIIALAAVCMTFIFGALELAVSVYARSFKEAQTYLSPITILAMIPAFAVYTLDPKSISTVYFNIPIVNIICIIKEVIAGVYNPLHIALGFGWGIIYIAVATLYARYMFSRESVIFRR